MDSRSMIDDKNMTSSTLRLLVWRCPVVRIHDWTGLTASATERDAQDVNLIRIRVAMEGLIPYL